MTYGGQCYGARAGGGWTRSLVYARRAMRGRMRWMTRGCGRSAP